MLQYLMLYSICYIVSIINRSSIFLSVAPIDTFLAFSTSLQLLPCVLILISLVGVIQLLASDSIIRLLFVSIYATDLFISFILAQAFTKSIGLSIAPNTFLLFIILILYREIEVKFRVKLNVVFLLLKDILPFIDSDPVAFTRYKGDLSLADYLTLSFSLLRLGYFILNTLYFPLQAPYLYFAFILVFRYFAKR